MWVLKYNDRHRKEHFSEEIHCYIFTKSPKVLRELSTEKQMALDVPNIKELCQFIDTLKGFVHCHIIKGNDVWPSLQGLVWAETHMAVTYNPST